MIEITTTEFCLLGWAIIATVKAMEYQFDVRNHRKVLMHMLDDERVYATISKQYHEWELNNNQSSREG